VENSQSYGYLVVGRGTQARYHEGHWWTAEEVIEEDVGELTEELVDTILGLAT
jgi:hypothetical protein